VQVDLVNGCRLFNNRYYCYSRLSRCIRFVGIIIIFKRNCLIEKSVLFLIVILGIGAFLIHFYWTKIGVAEIWNTTKWSSMRSSFYRTIRRFSRRSESKLGSERALSNASIYSDGIDDISLDKPISNPKITSYITPTNNTVQKPISVIPYNNPVGTNYARKISQPVQNAKIYNVNESNNLASRIQKQQF
jgi:hypothetical protein